MTDGGPCERPGRSLPRRPLVLATVFLLAAACARLRPVGDRAAGGRWERRAGLATPRDDFAIATSGSRLVVMGGMNGERGDPLETSEVFDVAAGTWTRGPRLPAAVSSTRAASLSGRIVLAGGTGRDADAAETWVLPVGGNSWERAAPLQAARFGHGLAALGGRIYAAGGLHHGEVLASVEAYDPARDAWTSVAPLLPARFNLALVALRGRLYALGGSGLDRRPGQWVDAYDPERDRWEPASPLPRAFSNFGAAALDDRRIHALLHRDHAVLDVPSQRWSIARTMPTSRHGQGVAALGGLLYAVGGCSEDPQRDLPSVEVFFPG